MNITKKTGAAAAVLTLLLAGLALVVGAGSAQAGPCNDEAFGQDLFVTVFDAGPTGVFVGVDHAVYDGTENYDSANVCVGAPDNAEPHMVVGGTVGNPPERGGTGAVATLKACDTPVNGAGCDAILNPTGALVTPPAPVPNAPGGGDGTGAGIGTPDANCVFLNASGPSCVGAITLVGATYGDQDTPEPEVATTCVNVNGVCQATVPNGASLEVGGSPTLKTVTVTVLGTPQSVDLPPTCISFNAICD
jgi:hypothetical protein